MTAQAGAVAAWRGLWDSQWVNIVNHANCYRDHDKEEAVNIAVRLTEAALRENNSTPPAAVPVEALEGLVDELDQLAADIARAGIAGFGNRALAIRDELTQLIKERSNG